MNKVLSVLDSILNASAYAVSGAVGKIINLWEDEPVAVSGVTTAVLDALIAFNAPIDADQKTAVIAVVSAIGVLIARSKVTPV